MSETAFSQRTISVVIIDDHDLLRGLLANALENAADLRVAGQGGDAESAVDLCRRLSPDVLILDSILPGMQGPDGVELVI
ncbi:MAG: response regulator transcription factor, partial [Opitutaceae bacterium]